MATGPGTARGGAGNGGAMGKSMRGCVSICRAVAPIQGEPEFVFVSPRIKFLCYDRSDCWGGGLNVKRRTVGQSRRGLRFVFAPCARRMFGFTSWASVSDSRETKFKQINVGTRRTEIREKMSAEMKNQNKEHPEAVSGRRGGEGEDERVADGRRGLPTRDGGSDGWNPVRENRPCDSNNNKNSGSEVIDGTTDVGPGPANTCMVAGHALDCGCECDDVFEGPPEEGDESGEKEKAGFFCPDPRPPMKASCSGSASSSMGLGPPTVETSDEEESVTGSAPAASNYNVSGITPLLPGLEVERPIVSGPTMVWQAARRPPLPRGSEDDPDHIHLNTQSGPGRTIVRRSQVTEEYIREQLKATGRAVKVKPIGGGMMSVEFISPVRVVEDRGQEDLREGHPRDGDAMEEEPAVVDGDDDRGDIDEAEASQLLRDSDGAEEDLRPDDDEPEIMEVGPGARSGGQEEGDPTGATGADASEMSAANDSIEGNKSYMTRSKGPPKRTGRISSTPKTPKTQKRTIKDHWADPSDDGEEEESDNRAQLAAKKRKASEAQRQRRAREKRQFQNRDWTSRSHGTLPSLPSLGEEPGEGQSLEGPGQEGERQPQQQHLHREEQPRQEERQQQQSIGPALGAIPREASGEAGRHEPRPDQQPQGSLPPRDHTTNGPRDAGASDAGGSGADLDAGSTSSFCPSQEMRELANTISGKCAGSGGDILDPDEEDMEEITDGEFVRLNQTLDATCDDPEQTRILALRDLVGKDIDIGAGGQLRVPEVVQFVVLKFDPRSDKAWAVPEPDLFNELMSIVAGHCYEYDLPCQRAYRWATLWGKVGLLGLSSKNVKDLIDYREVVEDQMSGVIKFTLFPKDALEKRGNLSVLLRDNLRLFNTKWLPKAILMRSRMRGGLRLTHIKHYHDDDRTREGKSKKGWRLALLQGCPEFMEELKKFDQDHRFPIGAGHVIIRGGSGRPRGTTERGRGTRAGARQKERRHHQDGLPEKRGGRTRNEGQERERSDERNYDRDFPASWGRHKERERNGGGSGSGGGARSGGRAWGGSGPSQRSSNR